MTGAKQDQRKQICDEVVTHLREYSEILLRNIRQFVEVGDSHGVEIIQSSCVGCLAHLGVLCDFIGRLEPNYKPQIDGICDWSLERLGDLTQEMCFDEYTYLDLLLNVRRWVGRSWWKELTLSLCLSDLVGKVVSRIRFTDQRPIAR